MKIYLASKSPRRRELLTQMGVSFELLLVDTPEIVQPLESPYDYSKRVTQEKLDAAWQKIQTEGLIPLPVLCADTESIVNDKIIGKPYDKDDAFNMLRQYSGKSHEVITSVGLAYQDYQQIRTQTTWVTFAEMTDDDIWSYLVSDNYKDKSGGYSIQSSIAQFISRIDGCFYSVMGLPLNVVREMLKNFAQTLSNKEDH